MLQSLSVEELEEYKKFSSELLSPQQTAKSDEQTSLQSPRQLRDDTEVKQTTTEEKKLEEDQQQVQQEESKDLELVALPFAEFKAQMSQKYGEKVFESGFKIIQENLESFRTKENGDQLFLENLMKEYPELYKSSPEELDEFASKLATYVIVHNIKI